MEWLKDVSAIAQTGAVGISLVSLWVLYKVLTNHTAHTNDVIEKNAESNVQLASSLSANTEVTRSLKETIERKL